MRLQWTGRALRDADRAAAYIARDRPGTASRWLAGLFDAVERLRSFPQSGRKLSEIPRPDTREVLYEGYRVVYRIEHDHVRIVTVFHQRRAGPEGPPDSWLDGLADSRGSHWEGVAEEIHRERDGHFREHDEESGSRG